MHGRNKKVLADQFAGRHEFPVAIRELVAEARRRYDELVPELTPRLTPYIVTLVPKLHASRYDVSTHRSFRPCRMPCRCALREPPSRDEQSMMAATVINCRDCLVHDTGREIRTSS